MIGAGVHGLSTAWHRAREGGRVLVLDKAGVAAGASGIACGIVRNNYFQPAMSELIAACIEVWESDPETLHYHGDGYIALGPSGQESDLIEVFERHQRIGYPSELHIGAGEVRTHMRSLYPDWRAPGITACLHEHAGGYAFHRESMLGLADKDHAAGAEIITGLARGHRLHLRRCHRGNRGANKCRGGRGRTGGRRLYRPARSGGVGAFTVDNFPVFAYVRPNVYVVADSNHGYKMIAVGREVARELRGEHSTLLQPFRYERFGTGDRHAVSHSPYPWS